MLEAVALIGRHHSVLHADHKVMQRTAQGLMLSRSCNSVGTRLSSVPPCLMQQIV